MYFTHTHTQNIVPVHFITLEKYFHIVGETFGYFLMYRVAVSYDNHQGGILMVKDIVANKEVTFHPPLPPHSNVLPVERLTFLCATLTCLTAPAG